MSRRILLLTITAVSVLGCRGREDGWLRRKRPEQANRTKLEIDGSKLRATLFNWADEATSEIAGTAGDIARAAPDSRTREMALRWKLRMVTTLQAVVLDPDPRLALVDTWMIIIQQRQYFTEGKGKDVFGDQSSQAAAVAHDLEERLEGMIREKVPAEMFAAAEADIERLAREAPLAIRGGTARLQLGDVSRAPKEGGIEEMLSLPLAPLTGLKGVGSTPEAINRISVVLSVITEIVENFPEQSRWQIEALLLELEAGRSLEELRNAILGAEEHIAELMNETKRVIDFSEQIPGEMKGIVDHIFRRLVQLVVVILLGVGLLVLLARRRAKTKGA